MADNGDEGILDLLSVAELGDVAHGDENVTQFAVGGQEPLDRARRRDCRPAGPGNQALGQ